MSYQWQKDNANLVDGDRISGATSPDLVLAEIEVGDTGNYRVVVTNQFGTTNSDTATVTVDVGESTVVSSMAGTYQPGSYFPVTITVMPAADVSAYNLEDTPPTGWAVASITGGGAFDADSGKVRWGPFADGKTRILMYLVTPPSGAVGTVAFQGSATFDGSDEIPIIGQRQTTRQPYQVPSLSVNAYAGLTVTGTVGQTNLIQYVTDLNETNNWITLTTLIMTNTSHLWFDPASATAPRRFYRVIPSP
ncbi:MAG: hypothetical protein M1608_03325 [Candidatus Omnitrophica bacterium]|nr:hypothetical protein [Candidatus Omnitrophota bacterium]